MLYTSIRMASCITTERAIEYTIFPYLSSHISSFYFKPIWTRRPIGPYNMLGSISIEVIAGESGLPFKRSIFSFGSFTMIVKDHESSKSG